MKDFANKVVVITGAASGMGRAYAEEFARRGARLALNDIDAEGLQTTIDRLANITSKQAMTAVMDVSEARAVQSFARDVEATLGPAHMLINNAGVEGSAKPVWSSQAADFERVMNINYYGVVHHTRAFLPQMLAAGRGVVVNVSSIFGLIGTPNHADYCASKFAVRGFTEALMVELHDTPLQVHLLHPGGIQTAIARQPRTQAFAQHFFRTKPEQITQRLLRGIARNEPRIVYGHGALKSWWGAQFLPLGAMVRLIKRELMSVIDRADYPPERFVQQNNEDDSRIRKVS